MAPPTRATRSSRGDMAATATSALVEAAASLSLAPADATSRSARSKKQMETRLRLRRRLLRIDADASLQHGAAFSSATEEQEREDEKRLAPQRRGKGSALASAAARRRSDNQAKRVAPRTTTVAPGDEDDDGSAEDDDGNGATEDEDGVDGEDDDEDDDDDADDEAEEAADRSGTAAVSKSDKCEPADEIKLMLNRGRHPTVWFDYPPHLNVTRAPPPPIDRGASASTATKARAGSSALSPPPPPPSSPSSSQGAASSRVLAVSASACPLFFKTHWERNCVKNAFAVAGLRRTKKRWRGWHMAWAKHVPRDKFKLFAEHQVFNHLPDPWVVGRKDRLMKTLTQYKRRFGASYAFFPEGFTLPDQLDAFKRAVQRDEAEHATAAAAKQHALWILKPPAAACGRGIRVVSARDVDAALGKERKYVIQRYLADPLLLDGFKFDLRIYVVVTSVDPLRIYLFQEGLTRFCTTPYSLGNIKNRFSHLTNYSVNKKNSNFVENTSATDESVGNKWSMSALLAHLKACGLVSDVDKVKSDIRDVICKTIIAAEAHLTPLMHQFVKRNGSGGGAKCYELFGFDMMLDQRGAPWLIEVNVSPSLMGGSPLDKRVKGLLLSDIFHLVGLPVPLESLPAGALPAEFLATAGGAGPAGAMPNGRCMGSTGSSRSINKQLHEIVHDPAITHLDNNHLELLSASDWAMIHDMEDEMDRLGHFERIYPCSTSDATARYAQFFTCPRYGNALCSKWIETCRAVAVGSKADPRRRSATGAKTRAAGLAMGAAVGSATAAAASSARLARGSGHGNGNAPSASR